MAVLPSASPSENCTTKAHVFVSIKEHTDRWYETIQKMAALYWGLC